MASIGAQKKKFVTETMDEKHNENMFFVFTTIFGPLGLPHPLLEAPNLEKNRFFREFFLDLAYGLIQLRYYTRAGVWILSFFPRRSN